MFIHSMHIIFLVHLDNKRSQMGKTYCIILKSQRLVTSAGRHVVTYTQFGHFKGHSDRLDTGTSISDDSLCLFDCTGLIQRSTLQRVGQTLYLLSQSLTIHTLHRK